MNVLDKIREIICADRIKYIREIQDKLDACHSDYTTARFVMDDMDRVIGEYLKLTGVHVILDGSTKVSNAIIPPKWLDTKKPYYPPQMDMSKIENGKTVTKRITYSIEDLYVVTPSIYRLAQNIVGIDLLATYDNIYEIWKHVVENWKYAYDKGEFWEPAFIGMYEKEMDCESTTVLFMTLLRAIGIEPQRVFNATGWVYDNKGKQLFGHSYPVVYLDEKIGWTGTEGWYIFESTLDKTPKYPQKWSLMPYGADWGLHNWQFGGQIKPEYWAEGSKYPRM